jgi:hypothetical protein
VSDVFSIQFRFEKRCGHQVFNERCLYCADALRVVEELKQTARELIVDRDHPHYNLTIRDGAVTDKASIEFLFSLFQNFSQGIHPTPEDKKKAKRIMDALGLSSGNFEGFQIP